MVKKCSVEDFEKRVFQITIGDLANTTSPQLVNDTIEFKDIKISFDLFKTCFFDNNYMHFEMNDQFRHFEAIGINNKVIKESSFYKNYVGGTKVNIIDILILKYMRNKKTRLDDISRISLLKDFNLYDSLVDFKVYNNHLSLDDVFTLFNLYKNKNSKKYFRFKIKTTYYSSVLDETISMYFNYIVKIPKNITSTITEQIDEDNISVYDDSVSDESTDELKQPVKEVENIVYSNYKKNTHDKIDVKDLILYDSVENISDDDDDDASESNITENSFENHESDDPFF